VLAISGSALAKSLIQIKRVGEEEVSMDVRAVLARPAWQLRSDAMAKAMQMLRWTIAASAVISMMPMAAAQTYGSNSPVCLQRWEWGGSTYFECTYASWDQCRSAGSGLAAMCVNNPYWAQGQAASPSGGRRRFAR
jgi:hypothetical protein